VRDGEQCFATYKENVALLCGQSDLQLAGRVEIDFAALQEYDMLPAANVGFENLKYRWLWQPGYLCLWHR